MLVWVLAIGGVCLGVALVALVIAMRRADRRARRSLFSGLGLDQATVDLLMARGDDVQAAIALARRADPGAAAAADPTPPTPVRAKPAIHLVHPAEPRASTPTEPEPPPADPRRLQIPRGS